MRPFIYCLSVVLFVVFFLPQTADAAGKEEKAKYVFYFIADGMGMNQVNGTEMYLAEKEGRIGIKPLNFTQFPVSGYITTYSVYNSVTCSAAAGTALASGVKTKNQTLGMDQEHKAPLYSIAATAKKEGKKVGVASNNSVDHATPGSFYAHQPDRNMYYPIVTDLVKSGFDYFAGSGFVHWENPADKRAPGITTLFREAGYTLAKGYSEFVRKSGDAGKFIFIQEDGTNVNYLPYAIDRQPGDMTLEQVTQGAIDVLGRDNENGFFLMIECGTIDWACHINDAATVFNEVDDFQKSIQKAVEFYNRYPDETLIVVTADHETGGLALGTGRYELNLKALQHQKVSKTVLSGKIGALRKGDSPEVSWEQVKQLLSDNLGLWSKTPVKEEYENELKEKYDRAFCKGEHDKVKSLYAEDEPLASKAIEVLNRAACLSWASGGHSAGYVPVFALGAGSSLFAGKMDNTDIPKKIERAMSGK